VRFPNEMVGADDSDPRTGGTDPVDPGSRAGPAGAAERRRADVAATLAAPPTHGGVPPPSEAVLRVVHQLRSPLAAIVGAACVLEGTVAGEHGHFVELIDRNVRRALRLVDELEREHRPAAADASCTAPVDLRRVARDAVEDAKQGGLLERHRVRAVGDTAPAVVLGDRDRLSHVFDNLLQNAVAYTPPGGTVTIAVEVEDDHVRASVRDTGCGIPAGERASVFDRFYRGTGVAERGIPGTGLGLAVVRDVVEAHGGTVGIDAVPEGGTRVWARLPLDPAGALPPAPASRARRRAGT
jgi:signal transduction histidine kinase